MNRRTFLSLTAAGLLVPEWVLDPPKGRSMVSVPGIPEALKVWAYFGDGTSEGPFLLPAMTKEELARYDAQYPVRIPSRSATFTFTLNWSHSNGGAA